MPEMWKLEGYDTFEEEYYPLKGEYDTEEDAKHAATDYLEELERTQPSRRSDGSGSGGQGAMGIQDRVFVVRPNGSKYRFLSF